jgi:hypothetical protein
MVRSKNTGRFVVASKNQIADRASARCSRRGVNAIAAAAQALFEPLERRMFLSGSNAIDRIDFGNISSESAHSFDAGFATLPQLNTGALGQTYRAPVGVSSSSALVAGNDELQFTMTVNSTQQNYLTLRLWGNDNMSDGIYLLGANSAYGPIDSNGGASPGGTWGQRMTFDILRRRCQMSGVDPDRDPDRDPRPRTRGLLTLIPNAQRLTHDPRPTTHERTAIIR